MSEIYRNPFALRASEKIADDETFLRFFSPASLDVLEEKYESSKLWNNVVFIQTPPGAGKTTLLRLFTPNVLKLIYRHKEVSDDQRKIYYTLKKMGVYNSEGKILICGIYLLLGRDFSYLEDFDLFENSQKQRMFMALLNARVILSLLKTIVELLRISKSDLADVIFSPPSLNNINIEDLDFPCSGLELFEWAANVEDHICDVLDGFTTVEKIKGNNSLFSFSLFKAEYFSYKGEPICGEFLFELDDTHRLTREQRKCLVEQVVETRNNSSLWIAERKDFLPIEDIICRNNKEGRDYEVIDLESISKGFFRKIVRSIADKRSGYSRYDINLYGSLDEDISSELDEKFIKIINIYSNEIKNMAPNMFENWFEEADKLPTYKEIAVAYKAISIFTKRSINKKSLSFLPYLKEEYPKNIDGNLLKLASLLLCSEHNMPLYYGHETLENLSTNNIEQFIDFAAQLYEKLIAKEIVGNKDIKLDAREQDDIIKKHCKKLFKKLENYSLGNKLMQFLQKLTDYCYKQSVGRASYEIVSGFAIAKSVTGVRSNYDEWYKDEEYKTLREIIRICIANNLLFVKTITQGSKGEMWDVLYLNKWLCAYKNIPLKMGGWRKLSLKELNKWLEA